MQLNKLLTSLALLTAIVVAAAPFDRAQAIVISNQQITIDVNLSANVFDVILTGQAQGGNWGPADKLLSFPTGNSSTTVSLPVPPHRLNWLLLGIVQNLPGDPLDVTTNHLAVFGNFTPDQIGLDYSTLFPGTDENSIISGLLDNVGHEGGPFLLQPIIRPFRNDAIADGLMIPLNGSFDAVAFSTGTLIGTGTSSVPEPSTLALLGGGLVVLGALRRRRKTKA